MNQFINTLLSHSKHFIQHGMTERPSLGCSLYFDKITGFCHHHIHVRITGTVFLIIQIEHGNSLDHADRNRGDKMVEWHFLDQSFFDHQGKSVIGGDHDAAD